jgi:hypothetical protein
MEQVTYGMNMMFKVYCLYVISRLPINSKNNMKFLILGLIAHFHGIFYASINICSKILALKSTMKRKIIKKEEEKFQINKKV